MHELRLDFGSQKTVTAAQLTQGREPDLPLGDFLARFTPRAAAQVPQEWLDLPLRAFNIRAVTLGPDAIPAAPPPAPATTPQPINAILDGIHAAVGTAAPAAESPAAPPDTAPPPDAPPDAPAAAPPPGAPPDPPPPAADAFPPALTDAEAVARAYAEEIRKIGGYLASDLSVLVVCDKVLVEHLYRHAVRQSGKRPVLEGDSVSDEGGGGGLVQRELAGPGARIAAIGRLLAGIKADQVLVLRHLDTLAGGSEEGPLTPEARLLTEVLYRSQEFTPTILGFADPSLGLPKVLADRFAVRMEIAGLTRAAVPRLVTRDERDRFGQFEPEALFKNVSGFNAIQLRNAMRYLRASSLPGRPTSELMALIREFKRGSSDEVEIPDVTFTQIGGYAREKRQLFEAIELITGKRPPFRIEEDGSLTPLPETAPRQESDAEREKRRKLAPRGFIFHGKPGTGKTLFAKAIANAMNATIQMVSGPEIMDMWVGKSESNLRRLFAIARRNAPAVIFFDEFDSIAAQRGGADGGSRAMNAVVAQLLTELDGFRADQDLLVIGTTNRLDIIDEALLRPSRFQPIEIDLPDQSARRRIAEIHARSFDVPLPDPLILDLVAEHTDQFNGDEIRAIFQEIAREHRQGQDVTAETFGVHIGIIRKKRDERQITHLQPARRR